MQKKRIEAYSLVVLIVLVGIAGVMVLFVSSMKKENITSLVATTEKPEAIVSVVPADWKTHLGDGYKVPYPLDWYVLPSSGITVVSSYDSEAKQGAGSFTKLELAKPQQMPEAEYDTFISNRVANYKVDSRFKDVKYIKESTIKVAGMPTTSISMKNTITGNPYYTNEFIVKLPNDKYFFVTVHHGEAEISSVVSQMLTAITLQ